MCAGTQCLKLDPMPVHPSGITGREEADVLWYISRGLGISLSLFLLSISPLLRAPAGQATDAY